MESEQDALFVLESAEKVETLSSCDHLILPFAPTPSRTPACEVYRQNIGGADIGRALDVVWDTANSVVRQVTVSDRSTSKQLRKYLFLSVKPSSTPFDWSAFTPPSSCRGSTFCSSYVLTSSLASQNQSNSIFLQSHRCLHCARWKRIDFTQRLGGW